MTVFNVEGLNLVIKHIAIRNRNLTDVILTVFKFVIVGIYISVLIGNVLCKRSAVAVGDKECYTAYTFTRCGIHLMNEEGGILTVCNGNTGNFSVSYFNIARLCIKNIIVCRLCFNNRVPAVRKVINVDNSACVCGVCADAFAVHVLDFKLNTLDRLSCFFVKFSDTDTAESFIKECKLVCFA